MHNSIVIFELIGGRPPKIKSTPQKIEVEIHEEDSKSEESEEDVALELEVENEESGEEKEFPQNEKPQRAKQPQIDNDEIEKSDEEIPIQDQIKLLMEAGDNLIDDEVF